MKMTYIGILVCLPIFLMAYGLSGYWPSDAKLFAIPSVLLIWSVMMLILLRMMENKDEEYRFGRARRQQEKDQPTWSEWWDRRLRKLIYDLERLSCLTHFIAIDWSVTILMLYFYYSTTHLNLDVIEMEDSTAQWTAVMSVLMMACFRRRLPYAMFSITLTMVLDVVVAAAVYHISPMRIINQRLTVFAAAWLTTLVYTYRAEIIERESFLNAREHENWRVQEKDISFEKRIGRGAFGEVYKGRWHGITVAIKRLLPLETEKATEKLSQKEESEASLENAKTQEDVSSVPQQKGSEATLAQKTNKVSPLPLPAQEKRKDQLVLESIPFQLSQKTMVQFETEIRLLHLLRHPNVVQFLGATLAQPNMLLVTEFCELGSLFDFLVDPQYKPIDGVRKMDIVTGTAHGLRYLHAQGILHRDLKSMNILLDSHFSAKICDFGLSNFCEQKRAHMGVHASVESLSHVRKPINRDAIGSIPWIAPEVFLNKPHSEASDIYSFAIVCWEVFAEGHPYVEELEQFDFNVDKLIDVIVRASYRPRISKNFGKTGVPVPHAIQDLIREMWHRNPMQRPDWATILERMDAARTEAYQLRKWMQMKMQQQKKNGNTVAGWTAPITDATTNAMDYFAIPVQNPLYEEPQSLSAARSEAKLNGDVSPFELDFQAAAAVRRGSVQHDGNWMQRPLQFRRGSLKPLSNASSVKQMSEILAKPLPAAYIPKLDEDDKAKQMVDEL
jgi:serine/threonine protein kinase